MMAEGGLQSDMAALSLGRCVQAALDCDLCEDTTDINWRCVTCPANICTKCKANHESRSTFKKHKIILRRTDPTAELSSNDVQVHQRQIDRPLSLSDVATRPHNRPMYPSNDVPRPPNRPLSSRNDVTRPPNRPLSLRNDVPRPPNRPLSSRNDVPRPPNRPLSLRNDEPRPPNRPLSSENDVPIRLPNRPLSSSNVRHITDIAISCNKMVEVHHNGPQTMLEYHKGSKWYISTVDKSGVTENRREFDFETHGFAVSRRVAVFVCDVHNNLIWRSLPNGDLRPSVDTSPDQPWGVCLNSDGNIVVCLKTSVVVFSKMGNRKIQTVGNTDSKGKEIFSWAYKIFQDQNEQYRLLDWTGRCVLGFGEFFDLQWNYKTKQSRSIEPLAICGDNFKNILVGYYSGTVEVLNARGNFLMLFEISSSTCPQQISVDYKNVLWVVKEYERKISLFEYI